MGSIKGLLVWPDNCMLLHLLLHVCRLCTGLATNFCLLLLGMQIRSEFNLNSPNSLRIRSQREFAANSAGNS